MYLANTSFHKQQQLGRRSPILTTSPTEMESQRPRCPALKAQSSPLLTPAGTGCPGPGETSSHQHLHLMAKV